MVFMGHGFTFGGQESGSVFSTSVCIIQASKRCVESLPLALKDATTRTHSNTDGNKLVIFSGIAWYYGDNYIV